MAVIEVHNLVKRFGPVTAVDGLSFEVQPGTVTGFLGPNGAGKPKSDFDISLPGCPVAKERMVCGPNRCLVEAMLLGKIVSAWHSRCR